MPSVSSNVGSVVGDQLFKMSFCSQAVETLLDHLELDKRSYRLGLSQVRQNLKMRLFRRGEFAFNNKVYLEKCVGNGSVMSQASRKKNCVCALSTGAETMRSLPLSYR